MCPQLRRDTIINARVLMISLPREAIISTLQGLCGSTLWTMAWIPLHISQAPRTHRRWSALSSITPSTHSRRTTREHYKAAKAKFDHYNVNNDAAARDFLLDLLELKLHDMVSKKLKDNDGFLVTWLQLIKSIQMTNIKHYETLKEQVKACCPSQFPGQKVTTLVSTFCIYACELNNAYAYNHNLTLMMLKTFLLAGDNDNKDYRMDLRIKKKELKKELKIVCHMGYDEAKEHMTKQDLTYKSICEVTENAYSEQADHGKWPPA